jgi:uncharacterized protein YqcC (DUF446 family)
MQTEIAEILIDVEAHLRQLDLWQRIAPPTRALQSTEPFCIDTLTLPQWLQFVFLPTLYRMLEQEQPLPTQCNITAMAEEYFRGSELAVTELLKALRAVDTALTTDPAPGS